MTENFKYVGGTKTDKKCGIEGVCWLVPEFRSQRTSQGRQRTRDRNSGKKQLFIPFYFLLNFVNRKFSREIKIADPSAEVQMEYDKLKVKVSFMHKNQKTIICQILQVNGRKYTWSDAAHAVMDMMDNSVKL